MAKENCSVSETHTAMINHTTSLLQLDCSSPAASLSSRRHVLQLPRMATGHSAASRMLKTDSLSHKDAAQHTPIKSNMYDAAAAGRGVQGHHRNQPPFNESSDYLRHKIKYQNKTNIASDVLPSSRGRILQSLLRHVTFDMRGPGGGILLCGLGLNRRTEEGLMK